MCVSRSSQCFTTGRGVYCTLCGNRGEERVSVSCVCLVPASASRLVVVCTVLSVEIVVKRGWVCHVCVSFQPVLHDWSWCVLYSLWKSWCREGECVMCVSRSSQCFTTGRGVYCTLCGNRGEERVSVSCVCLVPASASRLVVVCTVLSVEIVVKRGWVCHVCVSFQPVLHDWSWCVLYSLWKSWWREGECVMCVSRSSQCFTTGRGVYCTLCGNRGEERVSEPCVCLVPASVPRLVWCVLYSLWKSWWKEGECVMCVSRSSQCFTTGRGVCCTLWKSWWREGECVMCVSRSSQCFTTGRGVCCTLCGNRGEERVSVPCVCLVPASASLLVVVCAVLSVEIVVKRGWVCRVCVSFQPVLHDWRNKGHGVCSPVCGNHGEEKVSEPWVCLVPASAPRLV